MIFRDTRDLKEKIMQKTVLGEIFGIKVHSPISRGEIRDVLKKQLEFKKALQAEKSLTEDQAFLEVADIFENFFKDISKEDKDNFEKIHSEEINAAPSEWFSLESNIPSNSAVFLETGIAGELYGMQVNYPFTRENIRKLVYQRSEVMKSLADSQGISLYQASNDLSDMQNHFIEKFSYEDQEKFLNLMTEEMIAHTNALNDETAKINQQVLEKEVSNINITHTISGIIVFCCLMFLVFVLFR